MRTLTMMTRDERAQAVLEDAIRKALRSPAPKEISANPHDNHSGEPAFYVHVEMPSENDIPGVAAQNELMFKLVLALERIDDGRFPYLYFGPRDETGLSRDSDDPAEQGRGGH